MILWSFSFDLASTYYKRLSTTYCTKVNDGHGKAYWLIFNFSQYVQSICTTFKLKWYTVFLNQNKSIWINGMKELLLYYIDHNRSTQKNIIHAGTVISSAKNQASYFGKLTVNKSWDMFLFTKKKIRNLFKWISHIS